MQTTRFINTLTHKKKFLIDYANIKNNIIFHQKELLNYKNLLLFFKKPHFGIPLLFPKGLHFLDYDKDYFFKIKNKDIKDNIFGKKHLKYKPYKSFIKYGNIYSSSFTVKKKYIKIVEKINNFNNYSKSKIEKLTHKYKTVCAFQTRNIPHLGHEKIIDYLLNKFDYVVINPIIGPKKKGDVRFDVLFKVYNFLIKNKYKNKNLSYYPIIANMFYAGPKEAVHHSNIRGCLGFTHFVVGRDHAGSENYYKPDEAVNMVKTLSKHLPLTVETIYGSYFCESCKKIVIKNMCKHKKLIDISGTQFRKYLSKKSPALGGAG